MMTLMLILIASCSEGNYGYIEMPSVEPDENIIYLQAMRDGLLKLGMG